jgi:carbonic anhydrase
MIDADTALARLVEGNSRYITGQRQLDSGDARRQEVAGGQDPFAIVLGCADSRVPPEILFDQGLGDLFVIRVAGNVVTPPQLGSIEFAVESFGTPILVVLGHSRCGAVSATLSALQSPQAGGSPNLGSLVELISPAVEPLLAQDLDADSLIHEAVRANVHAVTAALSANSAILAARIASGDLRVIPAEYSLDTGQVELLS